MTDVPTTRPDEGMVFPRGRTDPPPMGPGSEGPACKLVAGYLNAWASEKAGKRVYGLDEEKGYTPHMAECMQHYQQAHAGLPVTGTFDLVTREHMREHYGFDFLADAVKAGGCTKCVQPDGSALYWAPGSAPSPDMATVMPWPGLLE